MATILECSELTKKYGSHRAVDNLNLQIERGRVYALLGPNGSGKSTFMKMAAGLIHPSSGKILFEGNQLVKIVRQRQSICRQNRIFTHI